MDHHSVERRVEAETPDECHQIVELPTRPVLARLKKQLVQRALCGVLIPSRGGAGDELGIE
jgi:hypothetical protein